ncbi:ABC transporter substrate-binding protein [Thermoflavimicrobium daqui]|jgi:peptide/nickel transport system substrate-binding protein|uniref:Solute-binding protein family 5 domain-containing protein n=1 Tax=Thermoflavimicrobium daqui TaxID=2137476 RepID=A0A364K0Z3_9BACL|nr:ABC transporter substrate-binding protein [Thermoflavimicrobium daqui]RAL21354.1 hypothetical protein DL897_16575 [Thermoflavimicrobium daqui]
MKKKWLIGSIALVMILSLFLAACGGKKDDAEKDGDGASDGKPVDGGKLTVAETAAFVGKFNPIHWEDETDKDVVYNVYDELWTEDKNMNYVPRLAEKWEIASDGKAMTIYLRKDAKWHDGKPVTADDLIFTYEQIASPEYTGVRFSSVDIIKGAKQKHDKKADKISGISKVDDHTVKLEFEKRLADPLAKVFRVPMPKHIFEKIDPKNMANHEATRSKVVGNGPFKVKEAKPNEYVILEKNKDYYRKGKPHLDQVVFKVISQDVAVGALKKGEVDIYPKIPGRDFDKLKKDKKLVTGEEQDLAYNYLGLDHNSPKFKDKRVRQALVYATDRQGIIKAVSKGHGYLINQHITKLSWAYNPKLENAYPYDPNKAKQLLTEAGYKDTNGDGFVEDPQGKPFSIQLHYPSDSANSAKTVPIIKENWKKAGIKADIPQPREWKTFLELLDQGKLETFLMAWGLDPDPDPTEVWRSNAEFNKLHYKNPESDKLIAEQAVEMDKNKRKEILAKWTEVINEDVPQIFLNGRTIMGAWHKKVKGVDWDYRAVVGTLADWWVTDAK